MIVVGHHRYGRAAEVAAALGPDIDDRRVRDWARRSRNPHDPLHGLLPAHKLRGRTYYRLDQAATVERITRTTTRGHPPRLDRQPDQA